MFHCGKKKNTAMLSMKLLLFLVMWLFSMISDRTFSMAEPLCEDEASMKSICTAVRHEYRLKTSHEQAKLIQERSICQQNVSVASENNEPKKQYTVGLCHMTTSQRICLIDGPEEDEFYDLMYDESAGTCIPDSQYKMKSKTEYLTKGKAIQEGALAKPSPPIKGSLKSSICDDITYMETVCVGLWGDYKSDTSFVNALEVEQNSICQDNVRLVSETGYTMDYYKAALCPVSESEIKCLIDGYFEDQIKVLLYELRNKDSPVCIWNLEEEKLIYGKEYTKKTSPLLVFPPLCDETIETLMKNICTAVRHTHIGKTSHNEAQKVKERSVCKQNVPLMSGTNELKGEYPAIALCHISDSQHRCLIDGHRNDQFYDLSYSDDDGKCIFNTEGEVRSKKEFLKMGEEIQKGALAMPSPPIKKSSKKNICDDERSMKKICVGLRNDYESGTTYKLAKKVAKESVCLDNIMLVSKTRYAYDLYTAAVCYITESQFQCLIDGYTENEFIAVPYEFQEDMSICIWSSEQKQSKNKQDFLKEGARLLVPPKKTITDHFMSFFRLFKIW